MNKRYWKSIGTGLVAAAVLLSGTTGGMFRPEVASAATAKPLSVDQVIGKLTAASNTLKRFHLNSIKKQNLQSGGMSIGSTNTLDLDINHQPKFAATGTVHYGFSDITFGLYANDKEFYELVDGSLLIDESEDGEEPIDPTAQYWIDMEKQDWDIIYSKAQFYPASMLYSIKNYKKSMKVSNVGSQTVLQFTITEPKAAKAIIELYDKDNVMEGGIIQPKSVTWKLYANKKTWQTEKLTVDLNYTLVEDGEKQTITTNITAKYSSHNKVAAIVKPIELE